MHKKRKETTHVRVCEKHTSIYKEYKYNVCQNGHKTHVEEINVSKVERKEKIHKILTTSLNINTPLTKISYTNPPPKYDYFHIQNYFPFLSRVTKGKSIK